jgi:hypothetical protein
LQQFNLSCGLAFYFLARSVSYCGAAACPGLGVKPEAPARSQSGEIYAMRTLSIQGRFKHRRAGVISAASFRKMLDLECLLSKGEAD